MAWLAVDKDSEEHIYQHKPTRAPEWWHGSVTNCVVIIPQGTIAKLIRRDMVWEDEPIEIK